jgi:hypothetical protein
MMVWGLMNHLVNGRSHYRRRPQVRHKKLGQRSSRSRRVTHGHIVISSNNYRERCSEYAGERCPRGMQRLLSSAVWDEAGVRDALRGYVLENFARISDGEYAFYLAHAPYPVPLAQLVRVAGSRWKIEDGFAASKELTALDEHQVRSWTSWHRARLRVPGRSGRSPASRQRPGRQPDDPPDPARDSQALRRPAPAAARSRHATALVPVATPASGHCPPVPLPAPPPGLLSLILSSEMRCAGP